MNKSLLDWQLVCELLLGLVGVVSLLAAGYLMMFAGSEWFL